MKSLSGQHKQVYEYLRDHPGATVREMREGCFPGVQKPCMRMSELKKTHGVDIVDIGRNKHREKMYKLNTQLVKTVSSFQYDPERNCMVEVKKLVTI